MRGTARTVAVAAMSAVALLAAGCGSGDSGGGESSAAGGKDGGEITVYGCNPQNPLVPQNTGETCGGDVLDQVFSKLVHYDAETAKPENDQAESIETTDNQNFTVKVKQGLKFHDGTDIKAKNFVDAWNYAAYAPNGMYNGYFFEPVEGFGDLQCTGDGDDPCAGAGKAKADKLTGLAVVDDYTFTIKTTEKVSNLPVRLGYSAFAALPDVFFTDPEAFGDKPVGSGPYKLDAWNKEQSIVLSKNADYKGDWPGKVDKITFKIYQELDPAYNDVLANNLDIVTSIPASALIDDKYKTDLPDRNTQKETGVIQTITFAPTKVDPNYADPKVRQAISMAIDRETINKQIFNGTEGPGHRLGLPGRRRLQGRPVRRVLRLRPGEGQGQARRGRRLQGRQDHPVLQRGRRPQGVDRGHLQQHQAGARRRLRRDRCRRLRDLPQPDQATAR